MKTTNKNDLLTNHVKFDVFSEQPLIDLNMFSKYLLHDGYSRPLMLFCETVNICNNDCIICAYSHMKRPKGIMPLSLFRKCLSDYALMGGGNLSLTPVVGDIFLDSLLLERIVIMKEFETICPVTVTTNCVMSNRLSDIELSTVLNFIGRIHISTYGIDREEYYAMTQRDKYDEFVQSVRRIISLISDSSKIVFGFRFLKNRTENEIKSWMQDNFGAEFIYGSTGTYANWGVLDTSRKLPFSAEWHEVKTNTEQCLIPLIACQVFVDGSVSFCHCDDFDINHEL